MPPPDPLVFLKHMNPLKIGIRIFALLVSEPMITISETIQIIIHGITGKIIIIFMRPWEILILDLLLNLPSTTHVIRLVSGVNWLLTVYY